MCISKTWHIRAILIMSSESAYSILSSAESFVWVADNFFLFYYPVLLQISEYKDLYNQLKIVSFESKFLYWILNK